MEFDVTIEKLTEEKYQEMKEYLAKTDPKGLSTHGLEIYLNTRIIVGMYEKWRRSRMDKIISTEQLHKMCKPGQGVKTCRYIVAGADGIECAKHTSLRGTIDNKTDMTARGNNCIGLGKIKYCICGSILENGKCTRLKCPHNAAKYIRWVIKGKYLEFENPVTLEEAEESIK